MNEIVQLFLNGERIAEIGHRHLFDDEKSTGRRICEGCLVTLNDFNYRVTKVSENDKGFIAHLKLDV